MTGAAHNYVASNLTDNSGIGAGAAWAGFGRVRNDLHMDAVPWACSQMRKGICRQKTPV